jgi:chromosome segregation ATPase
MQTVSERLEVLAQQKNDLKTYISLDKTRRALEYCLHEFRLKAAVEEIEAVS